MLTPTACLGISAEACRICEMIEDEVEYGASISIEGLNWGVSLESLTISAAGDELFWPLKVSSASP